MLPEKSSWAETTAVALILSSFAFLAFFPRLNPRLRAWGEDAAAYIAQQAVNNDGPAVKLGLPPIAAE